MPEIRGERFEGHKANGNWSTDIPKGIFIYLNYNNLKILLSRHCIDSALFLMERVINKIVNTYQRPPDDND